MAEAPVAERARQWQRRKEHRPGEILQAAFEVFSQHGYSAAKLSDVAERAGVTKGTIYFYFESKEQLFISMIKEMMRPTTDHLEKIVGNEVDSTLTLLRRHFDFMYHHMTDDGCAREIMRLLISEGARFPNLVDRWQREVLSPMTGMLTRLLRRGVDRGEIRDTGICDYPEILIGPAVMLNMMRMMFDDRLEIDVDRWFQVHLDLILHGLAAAPEPAVRDA